MAILSFIQIGLTHTKNNIENIKIAKRKFITTQARIIIACCRDFFVRSESFEIFS
jgi:hypothetical protein